MEGEEFGLFSLEEDEFNDLFIMQNSDGNQCNKENNETDKNEGVLGVEDMDVEMQDMHFAESEGGVKPIYSDIADPEDDFVNPVYGRTNR